MQGNTVFLPMVKNFIIENMPKGGYLFASNRLKDKNIRLDNKAVLAEVRLLKKECKIPVIVECLLFMRENNIPLDSYCSDFLEHHSKK